MIDDNMDKFEIIPEEKSRVKFGNEVGEPPLVVVIQGGKNVKLFYIF
jgi:hypothetical protein